MDKRYRNYRQRKFQEWKEKIKQMLPELVIKFYQHDKYIPYEKHVQLGRVIAAINNPFYTIQDDNFNNLDEMEELSKEVLLKIITEDLIKFVNNLHTTPELLNPSNK